MRLDETAIQGNDAVRTSASEQILGESFISDAVRDCVQWLEAQTATWGIGTFWGGAVAAIIAVAAVLLVCLIGNLIAKSIIHGLVHKLLRRSSTAWGQALMKHRVLLRLSHLVPVALLILALPAFRDYGVDWWLRPLVEIYVIWILLMVAFGLLEVGEAVIRHRGLEDRIPETGISQALKIVLSLVAVVLVFSVLFSKSPLWFLSGIGALAAVLMLIFKDAILGLVAGIQISVNDMVRVGDWITIPSKSVDGDVEEITLTTVRIRAFDKTTVLIPAYDLMTNPFTNWRGMSDSGGRRIKRSIHIDLSTVRFVERDDLERYRRFALLTDELDRRIDAIDAWNAEHGIDTSTKINGRQQTNLGVFRAYVEAYLRQHSMVHDEGFTFLVRHLDPGPTGLPLQIYVFTTDNRWVPYEQIQADIFDHLLAAMPGFDLAVFQSPSGHDVAAALRETQGQ